ncbi:MAG: hypothetical protein WC413_04065 [Candidatus Nanoarchaeia archaeon]
MVRNILLSKDKVFYLVEGNSHVVVWKQSGDVVIETPEMSLRGGIESKAIKGFALDELTNELSIQLLRPGKSSKINIGIVENYNKSLEWVNSVNKLYEL